MYQWLASLVKYVSESTAADIKGYYIFYEILMYHSDCF